MTRPIDSHCHVSDRWYEPVDTLLFEMDRCGVERAVLIQLLGGTSDAAMRTARNAHPGRFAWVGAIDPAALAWREAIDNAAQAGAAGLRLRAGWRSEGDDPLAPWRAVEAARLRVSLVGSASSFTDGKLAEVAEACPNLPLVLEHLGGLARPDVGNRAKALPAICALARHANVFLKLPGLGQLAPRHSDFDRADHPLDLSGTGELLDPVVQAFGPARLMWGSDFPPVAAREGYANALRWMRDFMADRGGDEAEAIFGANALRVWFGGR